VPLCRFVRESQSFGRIFYPLLQSRWIQPICPKITHPSPYSHGVAPHTTAVWAIALTSNVATSLFVLTMDCVVPWDNFPVVSHANLYSKSRCHQHYAALSPPPTPPPPPPPLSLRHHPNVTWCFVLLVYQKYVVTFSVICLGIVRVGSGTAVRLPKRCSCVLLSTQPSSSVSGGLHASRLGVSSTARRLHPLGRGDRVGPNAVLDSIGKKVSACDRNRTRFLSPPNRSLVATV
jgi:hypothetical protein